MSRSLFAKLLRTYGTPPSGAERRQFALEQQAAYEAQFVSEQLRAMPAAPSSVIIIGAGFAGLSAAYHLVRNGHKVTVLEAGDRSGGRVLSKRDSFATGQVIEFGAELIGANHRTWVELAIEFGLSFNVVTNDEMFEEAELTGPLIIGGRSIDRPTAERLTHNLERAFELLDTAAEIVNEKTPWDSPDAQKIDNELLGRWFYSRVKEMGLSEADAQLLLEALDAEFTNDNAVSWQTQSLLAVLTQIKAHGGGKRFGDFTEVYRCSAGNDVLAGKMMEKIGAININFNQPVVDIVFNNDNIQVCTRPLRNPKQKIIYTAAYAVLATPPTTWEHITRDAGILDLRTQTGPAVKFMAAVADRFWIKNKIAPSGLAGAVGMTWEGSDNQSELPGREMDLSCFAGGDFAARILQEGDRNAFCSKHFEQIFKGFDKSVRKRHFQSWPEEPYINTGYSFPGKGEVCSKIKYLNQAYKKRLFFAGEHTCAGYWGFMEGALKAGKIAAENIWKAQVTEDEAK